MFDEYRDIPLRYIFIFPTNVGIFRSPPVFRLKYSAVPMKANPATREDTAA